LTHFALQKPSECTCTRKERACFETEVGWYLQIWSHLTNWINCSLGAVFCTDQQLTIQTQNKHSEMGFSPSSRASRQRGASVLFWGWWMMTLMS
jgi:hypothetical protein